MFQEGKELLVMLKQSPIQIGNFWVFAIQIASPQSKQFLLNRDRFFDQLFPGERGRSANRNPAAKTVPQAKTPRQLHKIVKAKRPGGDAVLQ
jgi:hypothetical protein